MLRLVLLVCATSLACTAPREAQGPAVAREKVRAPVDVTLAVSAPSGRVVATLTLEATGEVPDSLARFVLPTGVTLLDGRLETKLGALTPGARREARVTLDVPSSGAFVLAAGVDAFMDAGLQLHAGTTAALGERAKEVETPRVDPLPKGDGVVAFPTEAASGAKE